MLGGMRLTICLRMGYTVFVASGGGVFIILGYRKSPSDATPNFHSFANAVSEWDTNPTFLIIGKLEKVSDGNCGLSASFGNIAA